MQSEDAPGGSASRGGIRRAAPYFALFVLVVVFYGDVLFSSGAWVPSSAEFDARAYCAPVRAFGYAELAKGNVPLWNPHMYSGTPFLAGFQSALLYPLNLHYLFLPLAKSMTIEIALHVYLLGAFFFAWARNRRLAEWSAFFAAIVVMFSAVFTLRLFAGHLTYINATAWAPLLLLSIDRVIDSRKFAWAAVGAVALSMAILAGHPQAVFCVLAVAGPYACARLIPGQAKVATAALLLFILLSPAFLAAAQLWPALAFSDESVRAGGLHYVLASSLSLPPENAITLFAPTFFGDVVSQPYWGRWAFWETCAFFGVATLALCGYAVIASGRRDRWLWLGLIVFAVVLSLGRYAPVYYAIYALVPGADSFRCPSRHLLGAQLFIALLAGLGAETLVREGRRTAPVAIVFALAAVLLGIGALWVRWARDAGQVWTDFVTSRHVKTEVWWRIDEMNFASAATHAMGALGVAAFTCLAIAVVFGLARRNRRFGYLVPVIGAIELIVFAGMFRESFDLEDSRRPKLEKQLSRTEQGARVYDMSQENFAMEIGASDIWGYDPTAILRYVQLMAYTQDTRAEYTMTEFSFKWYHPVYRMMRCAYVINSRKRGKIVNEVGPPLPRALLLDQYKVIGDAETRFATIADLSFTPESVVILEEEPNPKPEAGGAGGTVSWADESTDAFTVRVNAPAPAILLVTDSFARDWQARAVTPGPQSSYSILPANHVLRAIPLAAGVHEIRFEYAPAAYTWGMRTSIFSGLALAGSSAISAFRRRRLSTWSARD